MDLGSRASEVRSVGAGVLAALVSLVAAADAIVIQDRTSVGAVRGSSADTLGRISGTLVPLLVVLLLPAIAAYLVTRVAERKGWTRGRPGLAAGGAFLGGLLGLHSYGIDAGWTGYLAFTAIGAYAGHVLGLMVQRDTRLPAWVVVLHLLVLDAFAVPALMGIPDPDFVTLLAATYALVLVALLVRYAAVPEPEGARKAFAGAAPTTRR